MRRTIALLILLSGVAAGTAAAQDARPAIAVLPFENGGSYGQDKENFEALQVGIPAMLASELSRNPAIRLIDRSETRKTLSTAEGGGRAHLNAGTSAKLGRALGARYVVMGSFVDFYGKFRVNARIIDAGTGEILKVVSNDDPKLQDRRDLSRIIQSVSEKIVAGTRLPAAPTDTSRPRTVPTEALTLYSRALVYHDRGDKAKATEFYQKALAAFPDYAEARDGLRTVGAP